MKIRETLERLFAAAAFAEEGEFDTAREIAGLDGHDEGRVCEGGDCMAPAARA